MNSILDVCCLAETSNGVVVDIREKLDSIHNQYAKLSSAGYRILGVAYKKTSTDKNFTREEENNMTLLGFISLFDPPKKDVGKTIANLRNLGVELKLITGDNELAAASLADQIGMETLLYLLVYKYAI
ncbi:MAG: HAD family hydrolase [Ginsengibacter sp.]